jgi:transglutaminase-like putative cysteine protease
MSAAAESATPGRGRRAAGLPGGLLREVRSRTWVDVAVLTALTAIGVSGFATAFDDPLYLLAGAGGLLLGTGAAVAAYRLRLGALSTALLGVLAYLALGTPFAVPQQGIAAVIPTLESLASLAIGAVLGWRDLVTLRAPASLPEYIAAVPLVATWLVALVGSSLALRWLPRRRTPWRSAVLLVGPALIYLASVLLGTEEPFQPGLRGIAFAAISLVWIGWRRVDRERSVSSPQVLRRKLTGTAVLVVAAILLGAGAGAAFAPAADDRYVLRQEIQPPFDPTTIPSPLAGYRKYTKDLVETGLFTVQGLETGEVIRLATMDSYDGTLWNVADVGGVENASGAFRLVGRDIPEPELITSGARTSVDIEIGAYDDVWLPSAGYPDGMTFTGGDLVDRTDDVRYNASGGVTVVTSGVHSGDAYRIDAQLQDVPGESALDGVPVANVELPNVAVLPDVVAAAAAEYVEGTDEPYEQLRQIELTLRSTGYFSHGTGSGSAPSRAGHGADRMVEMLERSYMVGDEEQYASLFALMARSLGYPARVVMGFAPEAQPGATTVTGDDVRAWVEVPFEGYGWVPFFPTPDRTDVPQDEVPKPQSEPLPQVRQPPPTENDRDDLITAVDIDDGDNDDDRILGLPAWVFVLIVSILVLLAIVFLPMAVVAAIKALRRRRRRRGSGDRQAAGAWDELLDRYSELGFDVPGGLTRRRIASGLEPQLPEPAQGSVAVLAGRADDAVFSGREIAPDEVDDVWTEAMASVELARRASTRMRRLLARYRVSAVRRVTARLGRAAAAAAAARPRPGGRRS